MTWTNEKTWNSGDLLTAPDLNTMVRDNYTFLGNKPGVSAFMTAPLIVTASQWNIVPFDTERWKTEQTIHSPSKNTDLFTPGVPGKYLCTGSVMMVGSGFHVLVLYNTAFQTGQAITQATPQSAVSTTSVGNDAITWSTVYTFNGYSDYVQMQLWATTQVTITNAEMVLMWVSF